MVFLYYNPLLHGYSYNLQKFIKLFIFPIHNFRDVLVFMGPFNKLFFLLTFLFRTMALEHAQRNCFEWESPFKCNQLNMEIHTIDIFSNCCDCLCKEKTVKLDEQIPGVWMNGVYWVCYVCDLFCWFRNNSNWSLC